MTRAPEEYPLLFSSLTFLCLFLPITMALYYLVPNKAKNLLLLVVSLLFYASGEPKFIVILLVSIMVNYIAGLGIGDQTERGDGKASIRAKVWLWLGIAINLGMLFYFKYFNFAVDVVARVFGLRLEVAQIVLPIGISFFTFQALSYLIDVYWGNVKPQRSLLKLALYKSLYPQLIAGPIVRYVDVEKQLSKRDVGLDHFHAGLQRFLQGLGKKVILANPMAAVADKAFGMSPDFVSTPIAWVGAIAYMLQIYFDFSGYSDMAIGLGKMLGFDFLENFNLPYISRSISEFWRRWHISLSSWFRDYLYIPLGGSRKGNVYLNTAIVFMATGIWHGAAWTFILWGVWHGFFVIAEKFAKKQRAWKIPHAVSWVYTTIVVLIGWVLFRAVSVTQALSWYQAMVGLPREGWKPFALGTIINPFQWTIMAIAIVAAFGWWRTVWSKATAKLSDDVRTLVADILLLGVLFLSIVFLVNSTYNPFIYFRF